MAAPTTPAAGRSTLRLPVRPDVPRGYVGRPGRISAPLRQDLRVALLDIRPPGRATLQLGTGKRGVTLRDADLRALVPRIPKMARPDPALMRLALIQREFNRVETRYSRVPEAARVRLANNCLTEGLWEVLLDRRDSRGLATTFHGWVRFPEDAYRRLFEKLNRVPYDRYAALFRKFPKLDGIPVPLGKLRAVKATRKGAPVRTRLDEPVVRFAEQRAKAGLLLGAPIRTYRGFADPRRQPIRTAKFAAPGFYDVKDPMSFDLRWLARPRQATWRRVQAAGAQLTELEIGFANGYRILLAARKLERMPSLSRPPRRQRRLLRLTFGIGTPLIYATPAERAAEIAEEPRDYLLLLDAGGRHLDNHHRGLDRVYLWREGGAPGLLHLLLVGYERVAVVAHLTVPWRRLP